MCTDCAAGTYQDLAGQTSCKDCAAGTYQDLTGQTSCTDCAAGTYSTTVGATSASVCTDCAAGTYQDLTGQTSCTACAAGKYQKLDYYYYKPTQDFASTESDPGWLTMEECEEYANLVGSRYRVSNYASRVFGCYSMGYNRRDAGVKCDTSKSTTTCIRLNRTATVKTSVDACTDCAAGTYQDLAGQTSCTACVAGTYQDLTGQTSCTDCAAGTYSTTVGATSASVCTECSIHQTSDAGATTCNGPYTLTEAGGFCGDYVSVSQPVETVNGVVQASSTVGRDSTNSGTTLDDCAVFCRNWDYFIHENTLSQCYCGYTGPKDTCNDWKSNTYNSYKVTKGDVVEKTSGVGDFSLNAEECAAYGRSEGYTLKYSGSISTTSDAMVLTTGIELHGMQDLPIEDLVLTGGSMCGSHINQETAASIYKRSPTQFIASIQDGEYVKMILLEIVDNKIKAINAKWHWSIRNENDIEGHWQSGSDAAKVATSCSDTGYGIRNIVACPSSWTLGQAQYTCEAFTSDVPSGCFKTSNGIYYQNLATSVACSGSQTCIQKSKLTNVPCNENEYVEDSVCIECPTHTVSDGEKCIVPYELMDDTGYCKTTWESQDAFLQTKYTVSLDECAIQCRQHEYFIHVDSSCYCGSTIPRSECSTWQKSGYKSYRTHSVQVMEHSEGPNDLSLTEAECRGYFGDKFHSTVSGSSYPSGCYIYGSDAHYNTQETSVDCPLNDIRVCVKKRKSYYYKTTSGVSELNVDECKAFGESVGHWFGTGGILNDPNLPSGCFQNSGSITNYEHKVFYNVHVNNIQCTVDRTCPHKTIHALTQPKSEYFELDGGMPTDVTKEECELYGKSIGKWNSVDSWNSIPSGCFRNGAGMSDDQVRFNTYQNSLGCSAGRICVHKKIQSSNTYRLETKGLPSGMTEEECKRYGELVDKWQGTVNVNSVPTGCYRNLLNSGDTSVHFNTNQNTLACSESRRCVYIDKVYNKQFKYQKYDHYISGSSGDFNGWLGSDNPGDTYTNKVESGFLRCMYGRSTDDYVSSNPPNFIAHTFHTSTAGRTWCNEVNIFDATFTSSSVYNSFSIETIETSVCRHDQYKEGSMCLECPFAYDCNGKDKVYTNALTIYDDSSATFAAKRTHAMSVGGRLPFYQEINQLTNGLSANLWSAIINDEASDYRDWAVIETVSSNTNAFLTSHVSDYGSYPATWGDNANENTAVKPKTAVSTRNKAYRMGYKLVQIGKYCTSVLPDVQVYGSDNPCSLGFEDCSKRCAEACRDRKVSLDHSWELMTSLVAFNVQYDGECWCKSSSYSSGCATGNNVKWAEYELSDFEVQSADQDRCVINGKEYDRCISGDCYHLIPGTENWIFHNDYQEISASSKEECIRKCTSRYSSWATNSVGCRCAERLYQDDNSALAIGSYGYGTGIYEKRCLRAPNEAECKTTQLFDAIKSQISKTPYALVKQDSVGANLAGSTYAEGCTFYATDSNSYLSWSEATGVQSLNTDTEKQYRICMDWGKLIYIPSTSTDTTKAQQRCSNDFLFNGYLGEEACVQKCREISGCKYISMQPGYCRLTSTCDTIENVNTPYKMYKFETKYVLLDDPNKRCE